MHHVHPDNGAFVVANGKYIWNHNEDFPLFLKSMFDVNNQLLDDLDETKQLFMYQLYPVTCFYVRFPPHSRPSGISFIISFQIFIRNVSETINDITSAMGNDHHTI